MKKGLHVDLSGVEALGRIHFIRAEWWREEARAVIVRYSVGGQPKSNGLRLDMDKKAFIDPLDDAGIELIPDLVRQRTDEIWNIVARARAKDKAFASV